MRTVRERVRQFREASIAPTAGDFAIAREWLGAGPLFGLFAAQEPRDIRHAAATARWLLERRDLDPDLMMAALLHDIGKGRQRRRDRVAWVLADLVHAGTLAADEESRFAMRRALARTASHPASGAQLLTAAEAPSRVIQLTLRHHLAPEGDAMLAVLQAADAAS